MLLSELPPPETLIEYPNGYVCALMFHYAVEGQSLDAIAHDNGFEATTLELDGDNDELFQRYLHEEGANLDQLLRDWQPAPEGWLLAGKWDADDGPVAIFIRKRQEVAK